ncbi:MAG TPA: transporter [Vicinamibacterales bacterium]|nr:transporter [Vicinamibacterales bacterium]
MMRPFITAVLFVAAATPSFAQQRPLQTEDPETIGAGRILVEAGVDYKRDVFYPLSGLRGNLFTVPPMGISIGVSSIAEIQVDAGLYQKLYITGQEPNAPFAHLLQLDSGSTSDVEDIHIGAKVRFLSEAAGRPAMGVRFSTRLPNASNESGLGTDMQDFSASIVFGKTVQSVRLVANIGMLILGNPTQPAAQDDLLAYSLSVARAISQRAEVVGEFVGRANFANLVTPGAEDRGLLRFGARYTTSGVRFDVGMLLGLTARDPEIGVTGGFTWVFDAFKVP